jgi:hypothetical protein
MQVNLQTLEAQLNDFDRSTRTAALHTLLKLADEGAVSLEAETPVANMHCHTFFSFNAYGYSPLGLVWLAKQRGFRLLGTVDFDVLDAVDEFLDACALAGVRGSAGLETRIYLPEFATREMTSPGEPGIQYHMGIGFTSSRVPDSAAPILKDLRARAAERNQGVIERLNTYLDPITIDYKTDVMPLTPSGNPTERHIVVAYIRAAEQTVSDLTAFWAAKLDSTAEHIDRLMQAAGNFQNTIRTKLMKKGGPGYVQPGPDSFPLLEQVNSLITACGALPTITWLDGTSSGEQAIHELLDLLVGKGCVALNVIPDRNWNYADPDVKRTKLHKLYEIVALAQDYHLPLNVGTEMNAFGQKLMDDFDAPELAPVRQTFLDGAHFIYGHTALQRRSGLGYMSDWAQAHLPERQVRNAFYTKAGYAIAPRSGTLPINPLMSPAEALRALGAA